MKAEDLYPHQYHYQYPSSGEKGHLAQEIFF